MTRNVLHFIRLAAVFLFICCLFGCASFQGGRFYSGLPLPKNEIALVWSLSSCQITFLSDERAKEDKLLYMNGLAFDSSPKILELLPGQYNAGITYQVWPRIQRRVNFQAGDIYIIYSDITNASKDARWRPVIVNINDYNKEDCERAIGRNITRLSCPDRDKIREWTMEYLQSKRPSMSYHLLHDPLIEEVGGERHFYNGYWQ